MRSLSRVYNRFSSRRTKEVKGENSQPRTYFSFTNSRTKIDQTPTVTGNCTMAASRTAPPRGSVYVRNIIARAVSTPRISLLVHFMGVDLAFLWSRRIFSQARSIRLRTRSNKRPPHGSLWKQFDQEVSQNGDYCKSRNNFLPRLSVRTAAMIPKNPVPNRSQTAGSGTTALPTTSKAPE